MRLNLERLDLIQDDLIENVNWFSGLSITPNLITAFGIFHHIPSHKLRLELMANICSLIQAGDLLIWSVFQYLDIPRLRRQVLDLKNQEIINFLHHKFNLDTFDLEFGDNILKWRMVLGKTNVIESYRYSHYFSVDHVQDLLTVGNLNLISDFVEQDKEGGTNRYLVCVKI